MSNPLHDLDDLAGLWAEEASADEQAELHAMACRVARRAALIDHADLGIGLAIAAAVLVALLLRPAPVPLAVGLVAAAALLWSSWTRFQLKRQILASLEVSDRADLLDRDIRRVTTALHHAQLGLFAAAPVFLLFAMLTHSVFQGGSLAGFVSAMSGAMATMPVGPAIAAALLTLIVQQARTVRRLQGELRSLHALVGAYREEMRLDRIALG